MRAFIAVILVAFGSGCRCGGSHLSSANPQISVAPNCDASSRCTATVTLTPLAIDFGAQPLRRPAPLPVAQLPTLSIGNRGTAALSIEVVSISGPDAAAFSIKQVNPMAPVPSMTTEPWTVPPGSQVDVSLGFAPSSVAQTAYSATLTLQSNDTMSPMVTVALTGALRPDGPPIVCANLTRVTPTDGSPVQSYDTPAQWAPLLDAPDAGYDFSSSRPVVPNAAVTVSAFSDLTDFTTCTDDLEDGRAGVTFHWEIVSQPQGATASFDLPDSPIASLTPPVAGAYTVKLTATDAAGHPASTTLTFTARDADDLDVQLSWSLAGGGNGVDLDLHLARPVAVSLDGGAFSGAFAWFDEGAGATGGDINSYSALAQRNDGSKNFDWGLPGPYDDPNDNLDDEGFGPGAEQIALRYPEDDPGCVSNGCTYRLFAHYFADRRTAAATACMVSGCSDGEQCDCAAGFACVANVAATGVAASGAGTCHPPASVQLTVNGAAVDAGTVLIGAPCELVHLADVIWPSQASVMNGTAVAPVIVPAADRTRFGVRAAGDLQCSPNAAMGGGAAMNWYAEEPR
jgi:hypothetical protein